MTEIEVKDALVELFEGIDLTFFKKDIGKKLINYEYENFERPDCGYWYEIRFKTAEPYQKELGKSGRNEWSGFFQVNVVVLKSIRTITPEYGVQFYFDTAYAAIAEVMKRGVNYKRVHITKVYDSSAIDNDDRYTMPITVEWYAHLEN